MHDPEIDIRHHPPERTPFGTVLGGVCCSCCCCCCCLHTAGALVGAAVGSGWAMVSDAASPSAESGWPSETSAVGVYWLVVLPLSLLVFVGSAVSAGLGWAAGVLIFGLPVIQVVAAAVALGVVMVLPVKNRRRSALAIGKVSLISVLAFILGVLVMAGVGGFVLALS